MVQFVPIKEAFEEIQTQEDFNNSDWSGAEELLACSWGQCRIGSADDEDSLQELYHFIDGNGELVTVVDNFSLYHIDEKDVVLYDDYEILAIIIKAKDKQDFESFM